MTSREFCYWLQGYFELAGEQPIGPAQAVAIRRHLAMVFQHEIDPSYGDAAHQASLSETHGPAKPQDGPPHFAPPGSVLPGFGGPVMRC